MSFILEVLKFLGILFCVLLVFNFIILVHEWGHFLAARWRGLKIEKFQIWMGKPVWKRTWNGVQYGLGTIPLGGFVQLPQMAPMGAIEGRTSDEPLPPIKPLDKIIVAFAGPLFSMLLAFAFACAVAVAGKPVKPEEVTTTIGYTVPGMPAAAPEKLKAGDRILEIDGNPIKRFFGLTKSVVWATASGGSDDVTFKVQRPGEAEPRTIVVNAPWKESERYKKWENETGWFSKLFSRPPLRQVGIQSAIETKVKEVMENSPAAEAGIVKGDVITHINGEVCYNALFIEVLGDRKPGETIALTVQRGGPAEKGGKVIETKLTPRNPDKPKDAEEYGTRTGIVFEALDEKKRDYDYPSPFTFVADCFTNTFNTLTALFSPKSSIGVGQMSGPVGIMNLYYNIFQHPDWWRLVLWFSVVLNVGLAIFNMLPLPVLDGGHITMALLEMVRGKAIGTKLLESIQLVCVLALFSFVIFVTFKDVGGIFGDREKAEPEAFLPRGTAPPTP
jgi:regulator of sigma E protease